MKPAHMEGARRNWQQFSRKVVTDSVLKHIRQYGLFWAHDPVNRAPLLLTRSQDGSYLTCFWFYVDRGTVFASTRRLMF